MKYKQKLVGLRSQRNRSPVWDGCGLCVFVCFTGEAVEAESYDAASMNFFGLECDTVESFEHHVMPNVKNKTTLFGLLHMALGGDTFSSCSCRLLPYFFF